MTLEIAKCMSNRMLKSMAGISGRKSIIRIFHIVSNCLISFICWFFPPPYKLEWWRFWGIFCCFHVSCDFISFNFFSVSFLWHISPLSIIAVSHSSNSFETLISPPARPNAIGRKQKGSLPALKPPSGIYLFRGDKSGCFGQQAYFKEVCFVTRHARPNKHEKNLDRAMFRDELYSLEKHVFCTARALYKNVGCKSGGCLLCIIIYI